MSRQFSPRHAEKYQRHLSKMLENPLRYSEPYRPQFHFTPAFNWCNDPNGLVYYNGEFHLFFQHNPVGRKWGNNAWGHAISTDLLHWIQLPVALWPDEKGTIWSGSAIVDARNTTGFQTGIESPMIAAYTSAGKYGKMGESFAQGLAFSNDRGRTWSKYTGNPVLPNHSGGDDRDPKIFWCKLTDEWVMVLYLDHGRKLGFFTSPDLLTWTYASEVLGFYECPDLFELPVDGNGENKRWVLMDASGEYLLGSFDGRTFTSEGAKQRCDYGKNFYAPHTFNNIPEKDGRRIQVAWMDGGKYPRMPFNQQLSFPCELTLQTFDESVYLCRQPIQEIEHLYVNTVNLKEQNLAPGENPLAGLTYDLCDLEMELEPSGSLELGLRVDSTILQYDPKTQILSFDDTAVTLNLESGRLKLRVLVDRTSIEVYGNDGSVSLTSCYLRDKPEYPDLELYVRGGSAHLNSLVVHEISSIWD